MPPRAGDLTKHGPKTQSSPAESSGQESGFWALPLTLCVTTVCISQTFPEWRSLTATEPNTEDVKEMET